ncbi:ATP-binding protein [Streptomyces sp. CA-250714]|uniref:ATP-binding protein n=1 Tax=Streptomyces sp. CA-250714 TaxID=3240060 RepID=UPI003D8D5A4C
MTVTAIARSTGHPGYTETLPRKAESARTARVLVNTALAAWGLHAIAGDSTLVVTELVANAVQHTTCHTIRVTVTRLESDLVRIDVVDKCRAKPVRRAARDDAAEGRGLALVEALTVRWGTDPKGGWGKSVWAELKAGDTC